MRIYGLLSAAVLVTAVSAQTVPPPLPFTMKIQLPNAVQLLDSPTLAAGPTLTLPADGVGLPSATASITITYTNTTLNAQATLNSVTLTGSTDFTLPSTPPQGLVMTPNTPNTGMSVQYLPSNSKLQIAKITVSYTEGKVNGSFSLNLTGTAPEFAYTYTPQPGGNSTLLNSGDNIAMPATSITATAPTVTLISITNKGSGQGVVNGISYKGAPDFTLAGLPFPPATVDAGKVLQFQVLFAPFDLPQVSGTVRVDFVAGRNLTFSVTGTGLGAEYAYDLIQNSTVGALLPGDLITMADAAINDKSQAVVRVRNVGNADGVIRTISVAGTGYSLTELPFLPVTISAGGAFTITVNFSPTQPGRAPGKLRVGADSFDLASNGLGAILAYAYAAGDSTFPLQNAGAVVFAPVAVGQTTTVRFTVNNTGTAPTAVNSISATGPATTTFTLAALPKLPVNIGPGEEIGFNVTFAPTTVSTVSGTLRIDSQTFTLTGIGNAPAPLPAYSFSGSSGTVDPRTQPAVSLALAAPYPLDLAGTLTLAFNSAVFANDPAVQFQIGGRTVGFTIPANTRQAVFANQATQMQIQSGTVAGSIVLTPTFATSAGAIDLTPASPPSLTLTIPQQAPVLSSVVLSSKTTNSFTLLVTGYATGRSITQIDFQFTPTANENVGTTKVSLNVDSSFTAWYQSAASAAFGSNFTVTVPFNLAGDVNKVTNVVDTIQSVSVTLTNRLGTSAAKSVDLH